MHKPTLILVLFTLLGFIYAAATPIFEASDELWHYPLVRHLADGNPLPVQDPDNVGLWKQEASQQPLYYALAAALTFWVDASDMETVRWLNPHVDNGVLTADGNINLVVHRPEAEVFPWQGTVLAVRLIRLFSVLMGTGTLYFTWRIACIALPGRPELALGAVAVNAFTPMFLFISGAVNNDNLAIVLSSAALFLMLKLAPPLSPPRAGGRLGSPREAYPMQAGGRLGSPREAYPMQAGERLAPPLSPPRAGGRLVPPRKAYPPRAGGNNLSLPFTKHQPRVKDSLLLGIVLGLAALTKTSALGLIPLALLSLLVSIWRQLDLKNKSWQHGLLFAIRHSLLVILPVLLIAGWWYYRNYQLYGDWLGWNAFIQVLGKRAHPASLRQLWGERWGFSLSYWGLFGGVNLPMPEWIYRVLNAAATLAAIGLLVYILHAIRNTHHASRITHHVLRLWPLTLLLLWAAAVFIGLVRWATVTWSSQGRLVFSAISAISVLLVMGLFGWLPRRVGKWGVTLLAGFMFCISAAAPLAWIAPAYRPVVVPVSAKIANPVAADFDGRMRLLGYNLATKTVEPGGRLELTLHWEALAPMTRDWSVFVHLNDPMIGAPIAQRDMYPGQGLLATRLLEPGQRIANRYVIQVPGTAYAPAQTELAVGLYDFYTGERLQTPQGQDAVALTQIQVEPRSQGALPNPVHYNFGDQLALVGYQLEPRRLRPGQKLTLTLYWQALEEMETDYTVFSHLRNLEDPSNRIYAQHDAPLPGGASTWRKGQTAAAVYSLTLAADTPPAVHEIEIGVYHRDAQGHLPRLQLVTPDGRLVDDFLILVKVRVD